MSVFSVAQNRQFYVGKTTAQNAVTNLGDIKAVYVDDGNAAKDPYFYIQHMGYGGAERSDLIPVNSVMWFNLTAPSAMARKLKTVTVTLDSNVNSGAPISGQDYILKVNFRQLYGMSDEDIYQKYGAVHAYKNMTAAQFYAELAYSLFKNFSRVYAPLLDIQIASTTIASATKSGNTITFKDASGTAIDASAASNIVIVEKPQTDEWIRGVAKLEPVYFDVFPTTVYDGVDEVIWGTVTEGVSNTTIGNGYDIADLEYFCMGERGDIYRGINWPDNIPTRYEVDETKQYYVLDIHYAYQGNCEDIQKSEKTLTIVSETKSVLDAIVSTAQLKGE